MTKRIKLSLHTNLKCLKSQIKKIIVEDDTVIYEKVYQKIKDILKNSIRRIDGKVTNDLKNRGMSMTNLVPNKSIIGKKEDDEYCEILHDGGNKTRIEGSIENESNNLKIQSIHPTDTKFGDKPTTGIHNNLNHASSNIFINNLNTGSEVLVNKDNKAIKHVGSLVKLNRSNNDGNKTLNNFVLTTGNINNNTDSNFSTEKNLLTQNYIKSEALNKYLKINSFQGKKTNCDKTLTDNVNSVSPNIVSDTNSDVCVNDNDCLDKQNFIDDKNEVRFAASKQNKTRYNIKQILKILIKHICRYSNAAINNFPNKGLNILTSISNIHSYTKKMCRTFKMITYPLIQEVKEYYRAKGFKFDGNCISLIFRANTKRFLISNQKEIETYILDALKTQRYKTDFNLTMQSCINAFRFYNLDKHYNKCIINHMHELYFTMFTSERPLDDIFEICKTLEADSRLPSISYLFPNFEDTFIRTYLKRIDVFFSAILDNIDSIPYVYAMYKRISETDIFARKINEWFGGFYKHANQTNVIFIIRLHAMCINFIIIQCKCIDTIPDQFRMYLSNMINSYDACVIKIINEQIDMEIRHACSGADNIYKEVDFLQNTQIQTSDFLRSVFDAKNVEKEINNAFEINRINEEIKSLNIFKQEKSVKIDFEIIEIIYAHLHRKNLFENTYRDNLAYRLLSFRTNIELERRLITRFKAFKDSHHFTRCDFMLNEMKLIEIEDGINCIILNTPRWINTGACKFKVSQEIAKIQNLYSMNLNTKNDLYCHNWMHSLTTCIIELESKEIYVSLIQLEILKMLIQGKKTSAEILKFFGNYTLLNIHLDSLINAEIISLKDDIFSYIGPNKNTPYNLIPEKYTRNLLLEPIMTVKVPDIGSPSHIIDSLLIRRLKREKKIDKNKLFKDIKKEIKTTDAYLNERVKLLIDKIYIEIEDDNVKYIP